jgi:deazaflavin-dependent oxidoreductase (nitroreductase family)
MRHVVSPIILRLGGPTLVVRGRRTGRAIRTVVPPFELDRIRYLVSGGGETEWVRNLRAAGGGELRRRNVRVPFRSAEIQGDERDRIVVAYRNRMGWRGREFFHALPTPSDHPVFRIEATGFGRADGKHDR